MEVRVPPCARLCLTLSAEPDWSTVKLLGRALTPCFVAWIEDSNVADSMDVVVSELLENAAKYAGWPRDGATKLKLEMAVEPERVTVEVFHPLGEPEHYVRLREMLNWISSYADPRDAYLARMRKVAVSAETGSGLGLVRISAEGPWVLTASVDAASILRVCAAAPLRARSGWP